MSYDPSDLLHNEAIGLCVDYGCGCNGKRMIHSICELDIGMSCIDNNNHDAGWDVSLLSIEIVEDKFVGSP
jgi:hypothetical protein